MLENLTDRMSKAIRNLRGLGKLSEENIEEALKEVRQALLSADVHFKVAKDFISRVKASCLGQNVLDGVTPGQQIIKIINDELADLLGEGSENFSDQKPLRVMMVGLHGAGKTTTSAKLAQYLAKNYAHKPALIACDVYRPAAIDQLETLATQSNALFFADRESKDVPSIGKRGMQWARDNEASLSIFDTAGRLQIDDDLIKEIIKLKQTIQPHEILLVTDSALGQEAVNVAKHFHEAVTLTGIVLTKLDGDARGGAALSMKAVTGVPIKFMGTGEKIENFDLFHPDRMAQRILGMGDVVSLVEKAQEHIDEKEAEQLAEKFKRAELDLNDFLKQLQSIKKMGSLGSIMSMLPGMNEVSIGDKEEGQLKRTEAIIQSMTPLERTKPQVINGSRRMRIANGSGVAVKDVNQLLKQFGQMRKMMKKMRGSKGKRMMQQMAGGLGGGSFPGMPGLK